MLKHLDRDRKAVVQLTPSVNGSRANSTMYPRDMGSQDRRPGSVTAGSKLQKAKTKEWKAIKSVNAKRRKIDMVSKCVWNCNDVRGHTPCTDWYQKCFHNNINELLLGVAYEKIAQ